MAKNASDVSEKWGRRLKGSFDDIKKGVQSVSVAPGVAAAAKADKMLAGITEAVQSGKWANRVKAVSLSDWQSKMIDKGIGRISAGVDGAKSKSEAFYSKLLPFQDSLKSSIQNMPDLTIDDSIQRVAAWMRGMKNFNR